MKFAFLGYHVEQNWGGMSKSDQDAMITECFGYDKKLLKEGHLLKEGAALEPSRIAKILRWQNGKVVVSDGPFAETKEQLGGVGMLEAENMEHAVELMSKHPGLHYGSTFEIRPIEDRMRERKSACLDALRPDAQPVDPHATKFASMGYIKESAFGAKPKAELDNMVERCIAFDEQRFKNGQWLSAVALQTSRTAKTLRAKGGRVVVTDGPYAETKECLGGLVVLAIKDMKEAVTLLSTHPALPFGVVIEIRPINVEISEHWESLQKA